MKVKSSMKKEKIISLLLFSILSAIYLNEPDLYYIYDLSKFDNTKIYLSYSIVFGLVLLLSNLLI
jgi:hypothetical protein